MEQFLEKYGKLEEMKHLKELSNKKMLENIKILGRHSPRTKEASYSTAPTGSSALMNTIDVLPKHQDMRIEGNDHLATYDTKPKAKPFRIEK